MADIKITGANINSQAFSTSAKKVSGAGFEQALASAKEKTMQEFSVQEKRAEAITSRVQAMRDELWDGKTGNYEDDFFRYESTTEKSNVESAIPFENVEVGSIKVYDKNKPEKDAIILPVYKPLTNSAAEELKLYRAQQQVWRQEAEALELSHADGLAYQERRSQEYIRENSILQYWLERETQNGSAIDQKI